MTYWSHYSVNRIDARVGLISIGYKKDPYYIVLGAHFSQFEMTRIVTSTSLRNEAFSSSQTLELTRLMILPHDTYLETNVSLSLLCSRTTELSIGIVYIISDEELVAREIKFCLY